jgi:hypothetical protein
MALKKLTISNTTWTDWPNDMCCGAREAGVKSRRTTAKWKDSELSW